MYRLNAVWAMHMFPCTEMQRIMFFSSNFSMTTISIIGTGNFGQAMAVRCLDHGYKVTCGSRRPSSRPLADRNPKLAAVTVTSIEEAIKAGDIIIVAIHPEHHSELAQHAALFSEKIVVDVSNNTTKTEHQSLAERLQTFIPKAHLVKAFNTVSAYSLENEECGEARVLTLCGADLAAKQQVSQLAQTLGFRPMDNGALHKAKEQENKVLELFPGWWVPLIIALGTWIFWFVYAMIHHFVYLTYRAYSPERIPVNISNKAFACTALCLLSLAFLPGCIAAFVQLHRGTKNRPFNWFLASWLKIRKQLGLYALGCVFFHAIFSLAILNPAYFRTWFITDRIVIPAQPTADTRFLLGSRLNGMGESAILFGVLGACLMSILGISSVPALGALLNWREWNFVQSKLGLLCLLLATAHVNIMGFYHWIHEAMGLVIQEMTFLVSILPWAILIMRVILLMPCVRKPLNRIRRGWEKNSPLDPEAGNRGAVYSPGANGFDNIAHQK